MASINGRQSALDSALERASLEPIPSDVERLLNDRFEKFHRQCTDSDGKTSELVNGDPLVVSHPTTPRRWVSVALATCLVLAFAVFVGTSVFAPGLTLADVEAAVAKQAWIHIQYENGEEKWLSPAHGQVYLKQADGRVIFEDRKNKLELKYRPETSQILEIDYSGIPDDELPPSKKWEKQRYLTDLIDRLDSEAKQESTEERPYQVERHEETVDGHLFYRFERFRVFESGERSLVFQVWIDSKTRLPVRSRNSSNRPMHPLDEVTFIAGKYRYPQQGPKSIYALGIPADTKIVHILVDGRKPQVAVVNDVRKVLDAAKTARDGFPDRFRLIVWPADVDSSRSGGGLLYWDGKPKPVDGGLERDYLDWSSVRIRQMHYSVRDPKPPLALPATAAQTLEWMKGVEPRGLHVADGKGKAHYSLSRSSRRPPRAQVMPIQTTGLSEPLFFWNHWPRRYQWHVVLMSKGREKAVRILKDPPDNVPGTVAVRVDATKNQRIDYYLDPRRDYICCRKVTWSRGGERSVQSIDELLDLQMLPSGQWFASKMRSTIPMNRKPVTEFNVDMDLCYRLTIHWYR